MANTVRLVILKKNTDAFSVMNTPDSLSKDIANFENFKLGATFAMFNLIHGIGYYDLIQGASVDALYSITAQKFHESQERRLWLHLLS